MLHINQNKEAVWYPNMERPKKVSFERVSDTHVRVKLDKQTIELPYHVKEKRPLLIFEGDIPQQGLPKASKQIYSSRLETVNPDLDMVRNLKKYETPLEGRNGEALHIMRRGIILPVGNALLLRYREHSLSLQWVWITLTVKDSTHKFVFLQSTY